MSLWKRRPSPPPHVRATMILQPRERVLAFATDTSGHWLVGTDRSLHLQGAEGWVVLPWQRIDRASWDDDTARLTVHPVADFGQQQSSHERTFEQAGPFLELLHDRVNASVLLTRHVPIEGSRGLRVVARRPPRGDGPIEWSCLLDDALDPAHPRVVEAMEQGLADAQSELGA